MLTNEQVAAMLMDAELAWSVLIITKNPTEDLDIALVSHIRVLADERERLMEGLKRIANAHGVSLNCKRYAQEILDGRDVRLGPGPQAVQAEKIRHEQDINQFLSGHD